MTQKLKVQLLLLLAIVLFGGTMTAQVKKGILSNVKMLTNGEEAYENPQWSPNDAKISFTKTGFEGLFVMDKDGHNKKQLSDAKDVGFSYQWSLNNDEILIRDTRWDTKGRVHAIWKVDLSGNKTRLSEDATYLQPASWIYKKDGIMRAKIIGGKSITAAEKLTRRVNDKTINSIQTKPNFNKSFFVDGDFFYLVDENGNKTLLNDQNTYCPVFSPDGTRIAYNQNDDVYVMNIDGSNKRMLSTGFHPTWINNTQIVFEITTDNGHEYTSGDLYMINIDGSNKKQLTNSKDHIEMYPSSSHDGSKILFVRANDGQVYSADIQ